MYVYILQRITSVQIIVNCTLAVKNWVPVIRATSASHPARLCTDSPVKKTVASLLTMPINRQKPDLCIVLVLFPVVVR
ncbi:hypothetical protein COCVIDRAFT_108216 [Bipolaris victoriae FI3]|uniref:Uncharacterized protein n=2 Tax=Bipolaris TaxID=33194 RepID=W6YE56_COCC2|nr:uncharacterized protein COCCADRAFT_89310 [Bipolaris zeicola 26-R-13]XP_014553262.1 hypothetical protein COCVIDRAFT_108216 [Bipolaris victoriae FI3]EUC35953.1 hypothetical protein COCCADRAFT_89310 [Bipolaris zeicola 26-R-13]